MNLEVTIQAVKVEKIGVLEIKECTSCCFYDSGIPCYKLDHTLQKVFNLPDCEEGYYYKVKENVCTNY